MTCLLSSGVVEALQVDILSEIPSVNSLLMPWLVNPAPLRTLMSNLLYLLTVFL